MTIAEMMMITTILMEIYYTADIIRPATLPTA